jgi:2-dehydropantoate 2-reductase
VEELSQPPDVVLLAVKATEVVETARALLPRIKADTLVVSLQNGICEDALAGVVGAERVIGCVVAWGATMHGPAELEVTSPGEFVIGTPDGREEPRLNLLRDMLEAAAPVRISKNIMGELYSKLLINACINSLGVLAGQPLGRLLKDVRARRIFIRVWQEGLRVAEAMGVRVEPAGNGQLDYDRFLAGRGILADLRRHLIIG